MPSCPCCPSAHRTETETSGVTMVRWVTSGSTGSTHAAPSQTLSSRLGGVSKGADSNAEYGGPVNRLIEAVLSRRPPLLSVVRCSGGIFRLRPAPGQQQDAQRGGKNTT